MKTGTLVKVIRTGQEGIVVASQRIPYVGTIVHVEFEDGSSYDFNRFELVEAD